jgi:DNA-binding response OmpR family regulator
MKDRPLVLIGDDEEAILESVSFIVDQEGYRVITAGDGNAVLDLLKDNDPDLVILDVMMPGKSGFEVCREIKSRQSSQHTYVILLTAMGQQRDKDMGWDSGADEFIEKPYRPSALRQRLREILGEHK